MADIEFEDILNAVEKLNSEQKRILKRKLENDVLEPTREQLLAEFAAQRTSGAFEHVESMRNLYANPQAPDITEEQLLATIREAATEWEQELDEFFGNQS